MGVVVEGRGGAVGSVVAAEVAADDGGAIGGTVVVLAGPPSTWGHRDAPTVAAAVGQRDARVVDVPDCGWFGGIGSLLARVAVEEVGDPARAAEAHVAYGLPGGAGAWRDVGPTVRTAVVDAVLGGGEARVDGVRCPEAVAVGRRLAWFPRPVGPAHAVAVPGLEVDAVRDVPTVRTWAAVGSIRAEVLQAIAARPAEGRVGRWLRRRAARPVRGSTADLRWAVVAELRDDGGGVVRAWANGTDPVRLTGLLLAHAAAGVAAGDGTPTSVVDLAPPRATLDALADHGVLRWSVARPTPAHR